LPEPPLFAQGKRSLNLWQLTAIAITVIISYFLAARLSLALLAQDAGVAVFWPAAGISSGILIGLGSAARWPVIIGVMAATIGANLLGDRNLPSSFVFGFANTFEAVLIAGLVHKFFGAQFDLDSLRRVLGLFAATITGTMMSGIFGTLGFAIFHPSAASVLVIALHWVTAGALGTITIAPLIIGLASLIREAPPKREFAEGAFALTVTCVLCGFLVFLPNGPWTLELAIASLCPLLLFCAARLRPIFTAAAIFICASTIVWTTTFGIGIFGDSSTPIDQRVLSAQATILALSFGGLVLAALFSERRLQETRLREGEARLQQALTAGGVVAWDWDAKSDEVRHSRTVERVLGVGSERVVSRADLLARVHPDDLANLLARASGVRPDDSSYSATFRYRGTESEIWLDQIGTAEFNSLGQVTRIRGLSIDISERMRFEQEISRAQRSAETADRAKSAFLAAASHDLRQPLQTLSFLQGALEQHVGDREGRKIVDEMRRSIDTMAGMLSSLLDVNRLESGSLRPLQSDFVVNKVFESVKADFLRLAEEKGLQWRLIASNVIIHSDEHMLEQMIRNLLSNAIRYTDHGKIVVGCRRAGDRMRIEVWDSGVGITGDHLPHIFEEYYRGTSGADRGGFGLGLAIVKRLGEILDHRIGVRSIPGRGTGFSIEVPRGRAPAHADDLVKIAQRERAPFRGNILIIEDETSVRAALHRLLKLRGINAVAVATGKDAVALVRQRAIRPDVLLSDHNLPGPMNGIESINAVRAILGWHVPAIVMTGDVRSKTKEMTHSHGISYLTKPFRIDDLLTLIQNHRQGAATQEDDLLMREAD